MLQIAICEDENVVAGQIENIIGEVCKVKKIAADIDVFYKGENLEKEILRGAQYDLLYLKMQIHNSQEIVTAEKIRKIDENVMIILISQYEIYKAEMFRLGLFALVEKPIEKKLFMEIFLEANRKICSKRFYFTFQYRKKDYKLPCKEILYFESRARRIIVYLQSGETEIFNGKLSEVEAKLAEGKIPFLRIHQSYLVNYHLVKAKSQTEVTLVNGSVLPVSEGRQKKIKLIYEKLLERKN